MSEQTIGELRQLLDADERDVAFLEQLPEAVTETLLHASRETLDAEDTALTEAIASGTRALPTPLNRIAHSILG